jgi:hypothetical protein
MSSEFGRFLLAAALAVLATGRAAAVDPPCSDGVIRSLAGHVGLGSPRDTTTAALSVSLLSCADRLEVDAFASVPAASDEPASAASPAGTFGPDGSARDRPADRVLAARGSEAADAPSLRQPQLAFLTGIGLVGLAFYGRRRRSRA